MVAVVWAPVSGLVSVAVELTCRVKSSPLSGVGRMDKPPEERLARSASVNDPSALEPVMVALNPSAERVTVRPLSVPADSTAPVGMAAISTDEITSEPSTSTSVVVMFRATDVSSRVCSADTLRSGASATASTVTFRSAGPVVAVVWVPVSGSVSVAVELTCQGEVVAAVGGRQDGQDRRQPGSSGRRP